MKVLVAGAGGFIGSHLTLNLLLQGHEVRAVDIKPLDDWNQRSSGENCRLDLRKYKHCLKAVAGCQQVYNLAASMGGMGFIENHRAECMMNSLINTHLLMAARRVGVTRYFFSSSACVYNTDLQKFPASTDLMGEIYNPALKESEAYPAMPEAGYGEEKLFSEQMCRYFRQDYGLETRIARFHNCYGPWSTYKGGREKAPAALCRKVIEAKLEKKQCIEVWGRGNQTRSFMYIDDCIKGIDLIMNGDYADPVNLGSSDLVSVDQLLKVIEGIAGYKVRRLYNEDMPKGVNGRNSDNTLIKSLYDWEPSTKLRDGMEQLYNWIEGQITKGYLERGL